MAAIVDELCAVVDDPRHAQYSMSAVMRAICQRLGVPLPCADPHLARFVRVSLAGRGRKWGGT